jgi:nucleotidyltransferase/DNA polymerase involved in DNA repair
VPSLSIPQAVTLSYAGRFPIVWPSPTGWWSSIPAPNWNSSTICPVDLMWGVGPVTRARLAEIGVLTIGQLARAPRGSLEPLLGQAMGQKLATLAWKRDPREIKMHHLARSAGAQSAIVRKPAEERVFRPTLHYLADRVGTRLRANVGLAGL